MMVVVVMVMVMVVMMVMMMIYEGRGYNGGIHKNNSVDEEIYVSQCCLTIYAALKC
jgi:hypothetical protein